MRWLTALLLLGLLLSGCSADNALDPGPGWDPPVCQDGAGCCTPEELECQGDPDDGLVCSCSHSWSCDSTWAPSTCSQPADTPDGGADWTCTQDQELERCEREGSVLPEGATDWSCSVEEGKVVCTRPATTPDGTSSWECVYGGGRKECKRLIGGATWPAPPRTVKSSCQESHPDMLIVLDRSGSMASPAGASSKWSQAAVAVSALVASFEGKIRWGLMLLPGPGDACTGGQVDVAPGDKTSAAINAQLANATPYGSSPIASSLQNAASYLKSVDHDKRRLVLLVTDGGESCGGDAVAQVKALLGAQIKTYVVGFGSGVDTAELDSLAVAGGTALSALTKYYQTQDQQQLTQALDAVATTVCE